MLFRGLRARQHGSSSLVNYKVAEAYSKQIAAILTAVFTLDNIKQYHYVAIPRGGHFVLGMLAYILDLPQEALAYPVKNTSTPLVVVDDCAFSGNRFGRFLDEYPNQEIIFAHLCSHPDLREAIKTAEPRIIDCIAAYDLKDLAREQIPDSEAYQAWQQRWRERAKGKYYWLGLPELVIFPWNEPDRPIWNPETNQIEDNWRLVSPDKNLKNWGKLGLPPLAGTKAVVRIPDQVAYTIHQDDVTLCNLDDETVYGLSGVAADIWRGLAAYGDLTATKDYLLELYDVDEAQLTADIQSLNDTLLAKGLLEPVNDLPPA